MIPFEIQMGDFENSSYRSHLFASLRSKGAVLIKKAFDGTVPGFERCASIIPQPVSCHKGKSLRRISDNSTYADSHYPSFISLPVHHEHSYCEDVPELISFGCIKKAPKDGQTPICDGYAMLADMPDHLVQKIKEQGLLYIRRMEAEDNALFRGWKSTYGTENKAEALQLSEVGGNQSSWKGEVLEVTTHRPGIVSHPRSKNDVWINQITSYHPSVAEYVQRITPQEYLAASGVSMDSGPDIQTDCRLGDGTPFTQEELNAIWDAYDKHTFLTDLDEGDFLLLDNFWIGHGRRPFEGERLICVRMGNN